MDPYIVSLLLGGAGLGAMAVSGLSHQGHESQAHGDGPAHGHESHAHGLAPDVHGHAHGHDPRGHDSHGHGGWHVALALMSPRMLFSVLLGLGLTGVVLQGMLGGVFLFLVALAGGIVFERVLVTPLWNGMMRFASKPALTLESCVSDEATAVTTFDGHGQGIVSVELDGQVVQLLATLRPADREVGGRVRAGARVRIDDVDAVQNRCTVSLL